MGRRPECEQCDDGERKRHGYLCDKMDPDDKMLVRCIHRNSRLKLNSLKYYLEIFSNAMYKKHARRFFIDLFAGPGKCFNYNDGEFCDGSSLIAYRLKRPFTDYIFVDLNEKTSHTLDKRIKGLSLTGSNVTILNMDANKNIDEILSHVVEDSISVTFIDPNGLDVHLHTLEKLGKFAKMDIILNFAISDLKRNITAYRSSNPKANLLFGSEDWPDDRLKILSTFKTKLKGLGFDAVEDDVEKKVKVKTPSGADIYYLIYASKKKLGLEFWRETKKKFLPPDIID